MTYPPSGAGNTHPHQPAPSGYQLGPTGWPVAPPPKTPRKGAAILLASLALLLLTGGMIAAVSLAWQADDPAPAPPELTQAGAERACRTAFGREWDERNERATGDKDLIGNVQNIEMLETWKAGAGYSVNGTIHYTLTATLINPIDGTIDLTCAVTGSDEHPVTEVTNRR